jgi:hypothetical protein
MTKLSVQIHEKIPTRVALENMEKGMTQVFRNYMKEVEIENLVNKIQWALEDASARTTGQKYWTGTLQSSIKFLRNTLDEAPGFFSAQVGVDLSMPTVQTDKGKRTVREYALAVEKGLGRMPRAYSYTESGYLAWKKGLNARIAKVLSAAIRTPWGSRNVATGRFQSSKK